MISHRHRCIFVHIPKVAGTSIEHRLGHFEIVANGTQDHRRIRDIEPISLRTLTTTPRRVKARIDGRRPVSRAEYETYFRFAFVRNPWDRVGSWFENVRRDPAHQRRSGVEPDWTFDRFVRERLDRDWALRPQLDWITDSEGRIAVDYVGRFERLATDFAEVAERIGLADAELDHLLAGSPSAPANGHYHHLYDRASEAAVAARYAAEIELFGYRFGAT